MSAPSDALDAIRAARDAGDLPLARELAQRFCERWPTDGRGWLWQGWLAPTPLETLHFIERAAQLAPGPATEHALRWARERVVTAPPTAAPMESPRQRARIRQSARRLVLLMTLYLAIIALGVWQGIRWATPASVAAPLPTAVPPAPTLNPTERADREATLAVVVQPLYSNQALPTETPLPTPRPEATAPSDEEWRQLVALQDGWSAQAEASGEIPPASPSVAPVIGTPIPGVEAPDSAQPLEAPPPELAPDDPFAPWPARNYPVLYQAQANDNLSRIAALFGLKAETLVWANPALERNPNLLSAGQELLIPPLNGVLHLVVEGDTVQSLAEQYKVDAGIIGWFPGNQLASVEQPLTPGTRIMVPGGVKPYVPPPAPPTPPAVAAPRAAAPRNNSGTGGTYFGWPATGRITQGYGSYHNGVDIAAPMGTPIFAAQAGEIVYVGWDTTGYGYMILIDHHNGWYTRYAHLMGWYYKKGTWVERGQQIALMGSTGNSTGPHVHFEIITRGYRYNPLNYLR